MGKCAHTGLLMGQCTDTKRHMGDAHALDDTWAMHRHWATHGAMRTH